MARLVFTNLLLSISATGRAETARRVAWIIQQAIEYAVGRGFIKAHEAHKLPQVLPGHAVTHFASIKKDELLGALLLAIDKIDSPVPRAALLVTAYCFPRVGELLASTWSEIDFKGHPIYTNGDAQRLALSIISAPTLNAAIGSAAPIAYPTWTCKDGHVVQLDEAYATDLCLTIQTYVTATYNKAAGLLTQVEAAQTAEELAAVVWSENVEA